MLSAMRDDPIGDCERRDVDGSRSAGWPAVHWSTGMQPLMGISPARCARSSRRDDPECLRAAAVPGIHRTPELHLPLTEGQIAGEYGPRQGRILIYPLPKALAPISSYSFDRTMLFRAPCASLDQLPVTVREPQRNSTGTAGGSPEAACLRSLIHAAGTGRDRASPPATCFHLYP